MYCIVPDKYTNKSYKTAEKVPNTFTIIQIFINMMTFICCLFATSILQLYTHRNKIKTYKFKIMCKTVQVKTTHSFQRFTGRSCSQLPTVHSCSVVWPVI